MATLEQLAEGIKRAHAAGNAEHVRVLGQAYREMQAQQAAPPNPYEGGATPLTGKVSELPSRQPVKPDLMTATANTISGITNAIPVIGPLSQGIVDNLGGHISQAMGGDFNAPVQRREELIARDPTSYMAGNIAGSIGSFGAMGATTLGANALGLTGSVPAQIMKSGISTLGLGTADNMARGQAPAQALQSSLGPAAIAAMVPGGIALAKAGGRFINNNIVTPVRSALNPENAAIRAVGRGVAQDAAAAPALTQAGERAVQSVGGEVVNADRFGNAIRTLTRTAGNMSPQADSAVRNLTQQRFLTQGNRAINFVQRLMGGATDDLALQDALRTAAQQTNRTAYRAAYAAPQARAIWTPEIRNLMQADPFRRAIQQADATAANAAAVSGQRAIRNPFVFTQDGRVTLRSLPGGGHALPNLEFWDIVQRNLRNQADQARRTGDNLLASQVGQMRTQLLNTLDSAVPQFRQARRGAAGFFGAEDAIEAGRNAATSTRQSAEIGRAVQAMSQAERDAFSVGYASEIIDRINATRDRVNVINSVFGSQQARELAEIALGPQRARELEAYVRAEQALHMLNEAMGNSTTARQLLQAGVLPAAGFGVGWLGSGGDLGSAGGVAFLVAAGRSGLRALGRSSDERVMQRIAEMLTSGDPAQMQRAIQNAAISRQHMEVLDAMMRGLAITARGTVTGSFAGVN